METLIWLGIGFGIILILAGISWYLIGKNKKDANNEWTAEEIKRREG